MSAPQPALTLEEAAAALNVTVTRVKQLLKEGRLLGPRTAGARQPRGAKRVWGSSLQAELERRKSATSRSTTSRRDPVATDPRAADRLALLENGQERLLAEVMALRMQLDASMQREDAARAALAEVKAVVDTARDEVREARAQRQRLALLLRDTAAVLADEVSRNTADAIADAYSDALTQWATPADAGGAVEVPRPN